MPIASKLFGVKCLRLSKKLQKPQKLSPSDVLPYTVIFGRQIFMLIPTIKCYHA